MADGGQVERFAVVSACGENRAIAQSRCLGLTDTNGGRQRITITCLAFRLGNNNYMYIRPSQPETPKLRNNPVFSAGAHDNKSLYLATISHESAQHSTSSLHAAFRLLLTSPIASARAARLLAIPPYWLTSFVPRGREHFHCSLG